MSKEEMIEEIKKMTVVELADLVKAIEEEFGVSAVAAAAPAAGGAVAGGTHHIKIFDYSRFRVRKLTPTEYGRLQGFPMDTWRQVVSNSQAYKQFGNAVTVPLAEAIGKSIIEFLREQEAENGKDTAGCPG